MVFYLCVMFCRMKTFSVGYLTLTKMIGIVDDFASKQSRSLRDLTSSQLSILPSQIFYNRLAISGTPIVIARREIFDIRTQLMAEDNENYDNAELIAGLEEGDLKPNFYEGGFKTWECALDLAKLAAGDSTIVGSLDDSQTDVHVIEVCIIAKQLGDFANKACVVGCRHCCAVYDFVCSHPQSD